MLAAVSPAVPGRRRTPCRPALRGATFRVWPALTSSIGGWLIIDEVIRRASSTAFSAGAFQDQTSVRTFDIPAGLLVDAVHRFETTAAARPRRRRIEEQGVRAVALAWTRQSDGITPAEQRHRPDRARPRAGRHRSQPDPREHGAPEFGLQARLAMGFERRAIVVGFRWITRIHLSNCRDLQRPPSISVVAHLSRCAEGSG